MFTCSCWFEAICFSSGSCSIKIFSLLRKMSLKEIAALTTILAIIDKKKETIEIENNQLKCGDYSFLFSMYADDDQ